MQYFLSKKYNLIIKTFLILTLTISLSGILLAQSNQVVFQRIDDGLAGKFVRCIIKDSKGFMWFGTNGGLNKYDGTSITAYEHNTEILTSICHNEINAICEDKNQNLWIATAEGLALYNREFDNFINVSNIPKNTNQLINKYLTSVIVDKDDIVWVGTAGTAIISYDIKIHSFSNFKLSQNNDNRKDYVNCLEFRNPDEIWIGTRNGLFIFNIKTKTSTEFYLQDIENKNIITLERDNSGNLWLANSGGELYKINETLVEKKITKVLYDDKIESSDRILSLNCDNNSNLYIGRENAGLSIYNIDNQNIDHFRYDEHNPYSISSNSIWAVYNDNFEKVWIGTYNNGVCMYDKYFTKFNSFQRIISQQVTLGDNNVRAFCKDTNNNIWIGTDGGGISIFDPVKRQIISNINTSTSIKLKTNNIMCIINDLYNKMWVGHWAGGVDEIDLVNQKVKNYTLSSNGAGDNNILSLFQDSRGDIWAGTAGSGLFLFNKSKQKFELVDYKTNGVFFSNFSYINSIYEDSENTIWIGTVFGLFSLDHLNENKYQMQLYFNFDSTSISSNRISYIYEDSKKNLWIGTTDNGLNLFDRNNKTFKIFGNKDGLASNTISGITQDKESNIWLSTNRGITKFNPETKTCSTYTSADGLLSNELYRGAVFDLNNRELFFGGNNGFNIIVTDSILVNPYKPIVCFTGLWINNQKVIPGDIQSPVYQHVSYTDKILLTYKHTSITINYTGINYTRASRNKYFYKLAGFDNDWRDAGNQTSATYTNLNPGKYKFIVKAANNDGLWCDKPAELLIIVKPPFWKTWWAYTFYILIIILILLVGYKIRIDRIKMINSLDMERLAREKEHELSDAKMKFFTNISHELRTPLSLILGPLESLLGTKDWKPDNLTKLKTAHRNTLKLKQLVNELLDFGKIEDNKLNLNVQLVDIYLITKEIALFFDEISRQKNIDFQIINSLPDTSAWIDINKYEKILNNLLSNAFKFTPLNGKISIEISKILENKEIAKNVDNQIFNNFDFIEIKVLDTGKGIDAIDLPHIFERFYQAKSSSLEGTGIGLTLVKSLVEAHHGTIEVKSEPEKGSVFSIKLPGSHKAYSKDEIATVVTYKYENKSESLNNIQNLNIEETYLNSTDSSKYVPELLIVDDNFELLEYLTNEFKTHYKIITAEDGKIGMEKALATIPDLIISDVMMPNMSGIELCKAIKTDQRTSHIPLVLLTAKSTVDDQITGVEEGADIYMSKPFNIKLLKTQINQLITNRRELFSRFSKDVHILPAQFAQNTIDQEFLDSVINYIINNITDGQLGVASLSEHMKLSRDQILKKIKSLTGQTAVEFIRCIRLKQALKLMESRKYSLAEIAYETGFTSPSYFTRSFKSQYGKSPSEFLKE